MLPFFSLAPSVDIFYIDNCTCVSERLMATLAILTVHFFSLLDTSPRERFTLWCFVEGARVIWLQSFEKMRNLQLCEKKLAACSLLKECQAATLERNLLYFANRDELCKLDLEQPNPDDNVCFYPLILLKCFLKPICINKGWNFGSSWCWSCIGCEIPSRRKCPFNCGKVWKHI